MKMLDGKTRIALKNVLFATDFSPAANAALPFAIQIARRYGAKVYGVHVRPAELYGPAPPESWPLVAEASRDAAKEDARQLEEQLQDIPHEVIVGEGDIWGVLASVIQDSDIDLIVLGTRGRTGLGKILLGSVAEEIFRQAPCPVFTVGPHVAFNAERAVKMHEILYPTDFSPESLAAAPYAVSLAQENQARLTLLHVFENPKAGDLLDPEQFRNPTLRVLRSLVPAEAELWCEPEYLVEHGVPADTILQLAEQKGTDLIVLGVRRPHGVPGAATHLGGALAHKVVSHAKCPVLSVRG